MEPRPAPKPRQHQIHLTPPQVAALVADYEAGTSITKLRQAGWSWAKIGAKYDYAGGAVLKAYAKLSHHAERAPLCD